MTESTESYTVDAQMKGIQTRVFVLYTLYSSPKKSIKCFSSSALREPSGQLAPWVCGTYVKCES
jgi:hypothetical protein